MWFSYDPEGEGFVFHATALEAQGAADKALDFYRDRSSEVGWDDSVTEICWGEICGRVEQTSSRERPPETEVDDAGCDREGQFWGTFDRIVEYDVLTPTPNSSA